MFLTHYLLSYVIFLVTSRDLLAIVIVITDCHGRKNLLRKIWQIILTHFWPTVMKVKNFQAILKNLALVNTNNSRKNNISYILKRIGTYVSGGKKYQFLFEIKFKISKFSTIMRTLARNSSNRNKMIPKST